MTYVIRYCESIGASLQKEKRGSIFIAPLLLSVLRDLTRRQAQSPHKSFSGKTSWFRTKSSRGDNFWKALETNLTKFVAGDELPEDALTTTTGKKSSEIQDPRFGRIASETSINRMASLPNLRGETVTPVYGFVPHPVELSPTYGAQTRYKNVTTESRYKPATRYEQTVETGTVKSEYAPASGMGTPESVNDGRSPYIPPPSPASYEPPEHETKHAE